MKTDQSSGASLLEQSRRLAAGGDVAGATRLAHMALEILDEIDADCVAEAFAWLDELGKLEEPQSPKKIATIEDPNENAESAMNSDDAVEEQLHGGTGGEAEVKDAATKTHDVVDRQKDDVGEPDNSAGIGADILASIRTYRQERDTGASEANALPAGKQTEEAVGAVSGEAATEANDFEDAEKADDDESRGVLERVLRSGYTMVGAVALTVFVVAGTTWALFFVGSDDGGVSRRSSARGGWPDVPYDEGRRGPVSRDEASSALKRAVVRRQRERQRQESSGPTQPPSGVAAGANTVSQTGDELPSSVDGVAPEETRQPILAAAPAGEEKGQRTPPANGRKRATSKGRTKASNHTRAVPVKRTKPRRSGRWFFGAGPAGSVNRPKKIATTKLKRAPIPIGDRLRARLDVGVSSLSHGQVMALLVEPFAAGDFALPRGALLIGKSRNRGARVFLDFAEVIGAGGKPWSLTGVAVDADMMKGITARKRTVTLDERQQAEIAKGVLGALRRGVAATAGPTGRVADEVVGGAIEETRDDQRVDEGVVYEVSAGEEFTVLVTE